MIEIGSIIVLYSLLAKDFKGLDGLMIYLEGGGTTSPEDVEDELRYMGCLNTMNDEIYSKHVKEYKGKQIQKFNIK